MNPIRSEDRQRGLTLLEARPVAQDAGMYLVTNGDDVRVSPIVLPGWWIVPIKVRITAPDRGSVTCATQVAA